ncbi:OB-fold protein [Paraburkholderia sp. GAS334]|uniref:OB-fold protein n=1 Tax=Paraburkholderia sp. GAS334 TaxID=3035131 RepID=UPI003D1936BF
MVALIGFFGLFAVMAICRQPNVKFFSVITLWNRKQKLTPLGSKLHLLFSVVLLAGIALNFAYRTMGNASSATQRSAMTQQAVDASENDATDDSSSDTAKSDNTPAPPLQYSEVMANVLSYDYQQNEVAADMKYKGKPLHVIGQIQSVNKDAFDDVWVGIATDNEFMPIHATLAKNSENQAATLQKGLPVAVDCIGAGMEVGSPMLDRCAIADQ